MLTEEQAFRTSYYCLSLALLTLVGLPVGCAVATKDNLSWDYLSDDINFLSTSAFLIVVFLFLSLSTGVYAFRQHRLVAFWVIP